MTIQWHLTTGPAVDVLKIDGYLGDNAVGRFTGAIGWALARGHNTLLLDCTRLHGWSMAGKSAVADAAEQLLRQDRDLVLIAPPTLIRQLRAYDDLASALDQHHAASETEGGPEKAWHSHRWDTDSAP